MKKTALNSITISQPDDWHLHLRDNNALKRTVTDSARCFKRAIIMPNLRPPVTNVEKATAYRQRILEARPAHSDFEPLMTLLIIRLPKILLRPIKLDSLKPSSFTRQVQQQIQMLA
jgi:dihydroorotase